MVNPSSVSCFNFADESEGVGKRGSYYKTMLTVNMRLSALGVQLILDCDRLLIQFIEIFTKFIFHQQTMEKEHTKTNFEKNCFSAWASTLNMGLINKVDMVCLSPVGYGIGETTLL